MANESYSNWREAKYTDRETYNGAENFADGTSWWVNWEVFVAGEPGSGVADAVGLAYYCPDESDGGWLWCYAKDVADSRRYALALETLYGDNLTEAILLGLGFKKERA